MQIFKMSHLNTSDESLGEIPSNSSTCTKGYYSLEDCSEGGNRKDYHASLEQRDVIEDSSKQQCCGNSYFNFLKDCRQRYRSMYNGHRVVNVGSQQWRAMSPHSRSQYRNTDKAAASSILMPKDGSSDSDDLVGCSDAIAIDSKEFFIDDCGKAKKSKKQAVGKAKGKKALCSKTKKRTSKLKKRCSKPKKSTKKCAKKRR